MGKPWLNHSQLQQEWGKDDDFLPFSFSRWFIGSAEQPTAAQPKPEHLTLTSRLEDLDFPAYIFFLSFNYRLQDSQHQATNLTIIAKQMASTSMLRRRKQWKLTPKKDKWETDNIKISNTEVEDIKYSFT